MPRFCAPVLVGLFLSLGLGAGCHQPRAAMLDRELIGATMLDSQLAANLRIIAMPGGRLCGTPNAEKAVEFVAGKCREYGLDVHFEPFEMDCWSSKRQTVTLLTDPPRELTAVALGRTMDTPAGGITAEVADVGNGSAEEFEKLGDALAGKFALVQDEGGTRWGKMALCRKYGAAGMLVMCKPDHEPIIGSCHQTPRPEPAVAVKHDSELLELLKGSALVRVRIELATENWKCRPTNVVADLPGHGPLAREQILITAHLDSWHLAEGGLDNGAGSATILEIARVLAQSGWRPQRTVRFVWFMGEELGLCGSEAYVRDHADELDNIVTTINLDMPGAPRKLAHFMHPEVEPFLKSALADLAAYDLAPDIAAWHWSRSDHAPFVKAGVCSIGVGGDIGPGGACYHTSCDTYESVDVRGTIPTAAIVSVLTRRLADEPVRPTVRVDPETVTLD